MRFELRINHPMMKHAAQAVTAMVGGIDGVNVTYGESTITIDVLDPGPEAGPLAGLTLYTKLMALLVNVPGSYRLLGVRQIVEGNTRGYFPIEIAHGQGPLGMVLSTLTRQREEWGITDHIIGERGSIGRTVYIVFDAPTGSRFRT